MIRLVFFLMLVGFFLPAEELESTSAFYQAKRRLLKIEQERDTKNSFLLRSIQSSDSRIVAEGLKTAGRLRASIGFEEMMRIFRKKDPALKIVAAYALSQMEHPTAHKMLIQNIPMQKNPAVAAALIRAVSQQGDAATLETVVSFMESAKNSRLLLQAGCYSLGHLWDRVYDHPPISANLMNLILSGLSKDESTASHAAFALSRYRPEWEVLPSTLTDAYVACRVATAKVFLLRLFANRRNDTFEKLLKDEVNSPNLLLRREAIKSLAAYGYSKSSLQRFFGIIDNSKMDSGSLIHVLEGIASWGSSADLGPVLERLIEKSRSSWIRGNALIAFCVVDPEKARAKVLSLAKVPNPALTLYIIRALGILGGSEFVNRLAIYLGNKDPREVEEAILALARQPDDAITQGHKQMLRSALERADAGISAVASEWIGRARFTEFLPVLTSLLTRFDTDEVEAIEGVKQAILLLGGKPEISLASAFLQTPSENEISRALRSRILMVTNRGRVEFKFFDDAPLAASFFLKLIERGGPKLSTFRNTIFHRVIPNFIVQGGDPRADGYGSPGFLIRDEISERSHRRGTMGVATAGRDTGGCQFFINLIDNFHLDGKFTLLGEVVRGMEVVDRLEIGDKIISMRVLEQR